MCSEKQVEELKLKLTLQSMSRFLSKTRLRILLILSVFGISMIVSNIIMMIYRGDIGFDMLDMFGENFSYSFMSEKEELTEILRDKAECCLNYFDKPDTMAEGSSAGIHCLRESPSVMTSQNNISKYSTKFKTLTKFNRLLTSFNINAAIIEPSILYCMLLPYYRDLLVRRNFKLTTLTGSKNFITYGIFQDEVSKLKEEGNIQKMGLNGFQSIFIDRPLTDWMLKMQSNKYSRKFISHILYVHQDCNFHVVVFHNRGTYLWHDGLEPKTVLAIDHQFEDNLFMTSSAYEKFALVQLANKRSFLGNVYIPSNPHYFLFQINSSRFLECDLSRARYLEYGYGQPKTHPGMSVRRFAKRTIVSLRQLKTIFQPLLVNFWIWSGTLLGWYRQCGIIPYTTDVDFAAWASEIENLVDIIQPLLHNDYIRPMVRFGYLNEALEFQLNCFNLHVDIFFMYHIENGSWYAGHSYTEKYYFRYHHPNFTLCSADLLGEKVQVPCEAEKVIEADYGSRWRYPVTSWDYVTSSKNRGPNIYWNKTQLNNAYRFY